MISIFVSICRSLVSIRAHRLFVKRWISTVMTARVSSTLIIVILWLIIVTLWLITVIWLIIIIWGLIVPILIIIVLWWWLLVAFLVLDIVEQFSHFWLYLISNIKSHRLEFKIKAIENKHTVQSLT